MSFLAGRFSGIFLSTKFSPSVMVVATNLGWAAHMTLKHFALALFLLFLTLVLKHFALLFLLPSCLISSVLLASTAGWVVESLYLGTAIMGFSISMQVASGKKSPRCDGCCFIRCCCLCCRCLRCLLLESLYLGTAIMGFSISMQVASGNPNPHVVFVVLFIVVVFVVFVVVVGESLPGHCHHGLLHLHASRLR